MITKSEQTPGFLSDALTTLSRGWQERKARIRAIFEAQKRRKEARTVLRNLCSNFSLQQGAWFVNHAFYEHSLKAGFGHTEAMTTKVLIAFSQDDAELVNDCPFPGKLGVNENAGLHDYPYIGVAYSNDEESLEKWARQFGYAEIMSGLDENWDSSDESQVRVLTPTP